MFSPIHTSWGNVVSLLRLVLSLARYLPCAKNLLELFFGPIGELIVAEGIALTILLTVCYDFIISLVVLLKSHLELLQGGVRLSMLAAVLHKRFHVLFCRDSAS